jgi:hypothetical protein
VQGCFTPLFLSLSPLSIQPPRLVACASASAKLERNVCYMEDEEPGPVLRALCGGPNRRRVSA